MRKRKRKNSKHRKFIPKYPYQHVHLSLKPLEETPLEEITSYQQYIYEVMTGKRTLPEPEMKDGKFVFHLPVYPEPGRE